MALQNALVLRYQGTGFEPGLWNRTMLAFGDSWMDVSGLVNDSLPHFLKFNDGVLIAQVARLGSRLTTIEQTSLNRYLASLLDDLGGNYTFSHVLLSAGGNDFIDAVSDVEAGAGLIFDFTDQAQPTSAARCINEVFAGQLVIQLNEAFDKLIIRLRASTHVKNAPVLVNSYDIPKVRAAGIAFVAPSWIKAGLEKNGIFKPDLQQRVCNLIFRKIENVVKGWAKKYPDVYAVQTSGTLIQATDEKDNDWLNEIHPNSRGWERHARIWEKLIANT
jgi:hypothetical protein